jgi:ribosomal protein S17E
MSEEEYLEKYGDQIHEEFEHTDDKDLTWLYSEYCEYKYREYINELAGDISERVFHEIDVDKLQRILDILDEE